LGSTLADWILIMGDDKEIFYITEFKNQFNEWQTLHATRSLEKAKRLVGSTGRILRTINVESYNNKNNDAFRELIQAVDTAMWCWSIRQNTRKGCSIKVDWVSALVDWVSALNELSDAYEKYQLKTSDKIAVIEDNNK
jgi:hypothetical protein